MTPPSPGTAPRAEPRRAMAVVAVLLGVLSLGLHTTLAWQLDRLGAFERKDVLFDADVKTRLEAISAGRPLGIKHPNLMAYFTPPITLAARSLATVCPGCGSEADLQRVLGTLVVPVASALKTTLVLLLFRRLGFSWVQATTATLLSLVSFSTLVFGSIPESYGLTALAMAVAYAAAAASDGAPTWRRIILWIAIGVFATGITLTNIAFVAMLLWAASRDEGLIAGGIRAAAVAILVLALTGASAYVLDLALVRHDQAVDSTSVRSVLRDRVLAPIQEQAVTHEAGDSGHKLRHFPTAVANAFSPPRMGTTFFGPPGRERFGLSLEQSPSIVGLGDPLGLSVVVLIVAGAMCSLAAPSARRIAIASIGLVATGWVMSVWGSETQLFSQHWHLAAVVLIAGVMTVPRYGALTTAILAALTLALAVHNVMIVRDMLALLAAPPA